MSTLDELTEIKEKNFSSTFKKRFSIVEVAGMEVLIETCFMLELDIFNIIEELGLQYKPTSKYAKLVPVNPYTIDNYHLNYFTLTEEDKIVMACYDQDENERYYYIQ
ncbi:hypothetical protein CN918_25595 [Priestia megaterium]|nr:hypothetical protein CN918_25595 [Priestia megaterium]